MVRLTLFLLLFLGAYSCSRYDLVTVVNTSGERISITYRISNTGVGVFGKPDVHGTNIYQCAVKSDNLDIDYDTGISGLFKFGNGGLISTYLAPDEVFVLGLVSSGGDRIDDDTAFNIDYLTIATDQDTLVAESEQVRNLFKEYEGEFRLHIR